MNPELTRGSPITETRMILDKLGYQTNLLSQKQNSFDPGHISKTLLGYFDCSNPPTIGCKSVHLRRENFHADLYNSQLPSAEPTQARSEGQELQRLSVGLGCLPAQESIEQLHLHPGRYERFDESGDWREGLAAWTIVLRWQVHRL